MLLTWRFQLAVCWNFELTFIPFARILSGHCANCQSAEICDASNKCFIHKGFYLYILFLWISIEILFNSLSLSFEFIIQSFICTNMHLSKFVFFSPFLLWRSTSLKLKTTEICCRSDIIDIRWDSKTEISNEENSSLSADLLKQHGQCHLCTLCESNLSCTDQLFQWQIESCRLILHQVHVLYWSSLQTALPLHLRTLRFPHIRHWYWRTRSILYRLSFSRYSHHFSTTVHFCLDMNMIEIWYDRRLKRSEKFTQNKQQLSDNTRSLLATWLSIRIRSRITSGNIVILLHYNITTHEESISQQDSNSQGMPESRIRAMIVHHARRKSLPCLPASQNQDGLRVRARDVISSMIGNHVDVYLKWPIASKIRLIDGDHR